MLKQVAAAFLLILGLTATSQAQSTSADTAVASGHSSVTGSRGVEPEVGAAPAQAARRVTRPAFVSSSTTPIKAKAGIPLKLPEFPAETPVKGQIGHNFDPSLLVALGDSVDLHSSVLFDSDRRRIRHAFRPTLDQLAQHLVNHGELTLVEIDGYCDATGPRRWNDKLSQARADAVVDYLVKRGVSRDRLVAKGHGAVTSRHHVGDSAGNRRVVVTIVGSDVATK
jgi:outer membrane protein OmpA-like peptidoglycan-associated protein